ncbi:hypothetical protein P170DRAFT_379339 [Aspergillus steynii IBT 23096]|uniref:Uncharacterized protein n=1 Tax=Aspergillus steynii IBT 23096 TaxID=1392250 RepID=A0A2I2GJH3_9EURO|nr:uncharacterized protein P170DRAFT_379339 [Aspergillus steynii IBT 23096]PLB52997.1 hypothetical protein P170DRAFT_379339 [Aspergillus steynii IBT 23096]
MATTPPPSTLRMPPTPRHGAGYDQYEPYTTRHSARLASQRASRETRSTPPPPSFPSHANSRPRKTRKQNDELEALSPPRSISGSPRKLASDRVGGFTAAHSLHEVPAGSGLDRSDPFNTAESSSTSHHYRQPSRAIMAEGMLPTPAKTPRKKTIGDAGSTARTLFPQFPPPSSTRGKKGKKSTGFSLDSFNEDNAQDGSQIQIYTDSRDRIPEVDESEENPFHKKPVKSNPHARTSRRRDGRMERDKEVNESVKRRDGMVYVFRGKKMFRKFDDTLDSEEEDDDADDDLGLLSARPDLIDASHSPSVRPLTRSSIKPRVLFPSANDRAPREEPVEDLDEEAATDIEDQAFASEVADELDNADVDMNQRPMTPDLNPVSDTPSSPGATIRSLRSRTKREDGEKSQTPTISETRKKRASPFDGWLRKKQTPAGAAAKPKKRDAETANSPGGPATKKTRGNRGTIA